MPIVQLHTLYNSGMNGGRGGQCKSKSKGDKTQSIDYFMCQFAAWHPCSVETSKDQLCPHSPSHHPLQMFLLTGSLPLPQLLFTEVFHRWSPATTAQSPLALLLIFFNAHHLMSTFHACPPYKLHHQYTCNQCWWRANADWWSFQHMQPRQVPSSQHSYVGAHRWAESRDIYSGRL